MVITSAILSCILACSPVCDSLPALRENNIPEIVSLMTPEEKAAILVGCGSKEFDGIGRTDQGVPGVAGTTHAIPRLGIPYIVLADGPAGLRISPTRDGDDRTFYCTGFPIGTMLSSTWNPELVEKAGSAMGNEVLEYGVDILLAPGANIHRNPLCGRNFEYYSEDPLLSGTIAAAFINGVQSNGVGTSLKHFAVNNQELNRLANDAKISRRALMEIYLRNFEIAVKKSSPWTLMTSYNFINGEHASESRWLLTDILRDSWGFNGAVMTDWGGGYNSAKQVYAGNEMIQPGSDRRYREVLNAIKDGSLPAEDIDKAVGRVLKLIVKTPKFKGYRPSEQPDLEAHAKIAKEVADEGVVLMKNSKDVLPLKKAESIALFGITSYSFIAGGTGSGNVNRPYVVDLKQGLHNSGFSTDSEVESFYEEYMAVENERCTRINKGNKWYIDAERAIEALPSGLIESSSARADAAVITFGRVFGEGKDRDLANSYMLTEDEKALLQEVSENFHAKGKKVIVILNVGGVVEMVSWQDMADAVILAWQPGQEGGNTVASVLSGEVNPSGHLPMTISTAYEYEPSAGNFPKIFADKPFNYSYYRQVSVLKDASWLIKDIDYTDYKEDIFVGYRHFNTFDKKHIAYPFGFGLSYTTFRFSSLEVTPVSGGYNVSVDVTNTGKAAGKDVVEIFVAAPDKDMVKPARELRGFAKTGLLSPGETQNVMIFIPEESLASYDEASSSWVIEKGTYTFFAAKDASDTSLSRKVRIKSPIQ